MNKPAPTPGRSFWKNVFLSPNESRLRAGWRLLTQTILLLVLLGCTGILITLLKNLFHLKLTDGSYFVMSTLVRLAAFTASIALARRFLDRRSFVSLGLRLDRRMLPDLLGGILITFIMIGLTYLVMTYLGWIQFLGFAWPYRSLPAILSQVLTFLLLFIFSGWQEELLSRGYHLQTLASGTNLFWGVVISSAIFGLMHLPNAHTTWASTVGIIMVGLFLALGYLRTRQLWLSIGLHIGWNIFWGIVLGFPMDGIASIPIVRISVTGPLVWTGGAFGPEAGLLILPILLLGVLLIHLYSKLRNISALQGNQPVKP